MQSEWLFIMTLLQQLGQYILSIYAGFKSAYSATATKYTGLQLPSTLEKHIVT